jgi:16S rRNA A1518/A1519 N6-dimethyltransferase RsmA/KsgA/DIM1 with predicted DNA glycosylase/AP lyase activity
VKFTKKDPPPELDPATYLAVTQQIFPYKNKTLRNAVIFMLKKRESEVDPDLVDAELADFAARRVRTLAPGEIAELAKKFRDLKWI